MNKCKKILLTGHTKNKDYLHHLYTDRQVYVSSLSSSEQPVEDEKRFWYHDLSFQFEGTGYRNMEKMVIYIFVPEEKIFFHVKDISLITAYEDFLLRILSEPINSLSEQYENHRKSHREKPQLTMQSVHSVVHRRNGCLYLQEIQSFRLRVHFTVPLINGMNINGKSAFRAIRDMMEIVYEKIQMINQSQLEKHVKIYQQQQEIRNYLQENNLIAFIGNGSILPRKGESELPMEDAIPFVSPKELETTIVFRDGTSLLGMGIPKGITVITGGGYSGKSTLLDSLEMGIYNHVKGDGREYVISEESACKICAEDGRMIQKTDISPFFQNMPGDTSPENFSTNRASGSVSQAVGIIEAVYGKSSLLLIDEDTSATNFMIRDQKMRLLVEKEPIIPFTDRIEELRDKGISTILVIGGSSEYLKYADEVILMEEYVAQCKTEYVKEHLIAVKKPEINGNQEPCHWMEKKTVVFREKETDFYISECVKIEHARYIKIDQYVSDITKISAFISDEQMNSCTHLLEKIIAEANPVTDILEQCEHVVRGLFEDTVNSILSNAKQYEFWLEEIRCLDLLMALCRLRN